MNELEQDKRYVFGDMIIVASIDANSNPILKISTDAGNAVSYTHLTLPTIA